MAALMRTLAVLALLAGCNAGAGSLELSLQLPADMALRPSGMTTVTVSATFPGESPIANTSALDGNAFTAGDLPVGTDVQLGVVLRDVSNRIVGVGEAGQTVDIIGDEAAQISIPVRKPFVYAAGAPELVSFDTTRDPRDEMFQGSLTQIQSPLFTVSVGGDRLAVVTANQVVVVATATNMIEKTIPVTTARDATAVPGTSKVALATATGITIVDITTSEVTTAAVGPVDKITSGPNEADELFVYGLVGRVAPPELPPPMGRCATNATSQLVTIRVDAPAPAAPKPLGGPVADIAAAPDVARLVAANPCAGEVARVTGDPTAEVATLALEKLADIERATVLTIAGNRIWVAGTDTATPFCEGPPLGTCTAAATMQCQATNGNDVGFAVEGASLIVASIAIDGGDEVRLVAPDRRETMVDTDDRAEQHAQVLKAMSVLPIDLVTLPGGQFVSVVVKSRYFIVEFPGSLPCLDTTTEDWLLLDLAASNVTQRLRTSCTVLDYSSTPVDFPNWECGTPPESEMSELQYHPTSVGALFGAR